MAQDVTQAVFLLLARTAPAFRSKTALPGWLFRTARFAAQNARTREQRRRHYEEKAAQAMQQQTEAVGDTAWTEIESVLNSALAALREGERECVLLRFFQGLSFAEAGAALGLSEEAARKRVTRALDKMRKFFEKGGIIVPGVALAALLSAHAAKAAPATCSAAVAHITAGAVAGHLPMGLTGSHIYQLSEGALKAMKMAQIKVAVGIAATLVVGFSTYAVAVGIRPATSATHKVATLKLGHVLQQTTGEALTPTQIIAHSRQAYGALQSYQGTTSVSGQSVTAEGKTATHHTSAKILFARPGKIRAEGKDSGGNPFAYVSDGVTMAEQIASKGVWKKVENAEMAIAGATGIAQNAATTVPALLLGTNWGDPFVPEYGLEVREDDVDGHPCYVVTNSLGTATDSLMGYFWIDEKTFLLRRYVQDSDSQAQTLEIAGQSRVVPAMKLHNDERFTKFADDYVLGFKITMNDTSTMRIGNCLANLQIGLK